MCQNDGANDETGEQAVSWRSAKRRKKNSMQQSQWKSDTCMEKGWRKVEKGGAVGFGDAKIVKLVLSSCGDVCGVLFRASMQIV